MRGEQPIAIGIVLVAFVEAREKRGQPTRRVAGCIGERDALLVGVELLTTVVGTLVQNRVRLVRDGREHLAARHLGRQLDALALLDRLDRVLLGHVRDLMREHVREFRFALEQRQRAARDVNEAARRGVRVHAVRVEHDEFPRQRRPAAGLRQHVADERHVLVHGLVLNDAEAQPQLIAHLLAERLLFRVCEDQRTNRVLRFLRLAGEAAELPRQLRPRRRGERQQHQALNCEHRDFLGSSLHSHLSQWFHRDRPRQALPRSVADDDTRAELLIE